MQHIEVLSIGWRRGGGEVAFDGEGCSVFVRCSQPSASWLQPAWCSRLCSWQSQGGTQVTLRCCTAAVSAVDDGPDQSTVCWSSSRRDLSHWVCICLPG
jgi:hypothetical protein